jgi:hypothetical protein
MENETFSTIKWKRRFSDLISFTYSFSVFCVIFEYSGVSMFSSCSGDIEIFLGWITNFYFVGKYIRAVKKMNE